MRQTRAKPPLPMISLFQQRSAPPMTTSSSNIMIIEVNLIIIETNYYMPVALQPALALWLKSHLNINLQHLPSGEYQLSYNDQIYLDNGYLIGILLRGLLREADVGTSLLKIRKIAHISSNQNWRILAAILQELGFQEQIDPHQINLSLVSNVLQFLWDKFGDKKEAVRKLKNTFLDIHTFQGSRPLESSQNLLEFLVLALQSSFGIEVGECLGLLIDKGRSLRQIIILGTNNGYQPVTKLYQTIITEIPTLNRLLSEQYGGQDHFLGLIGGGVLSQSPQVCHLCCCLIESIDSDWPMYKGIDTFIRSPHFVALDLFLHRIEHKLQEVFNEELHKRFGGHTNNQLRTYNQLIRYFNQSLFGKETLKCLEISYYITRALEVFQPEQKINFSSKERTNARQLLASITKYFQKKLNPRDHNQILYCFQFSLTDNEEERIASLSILFDLLFDIFEKQRDFGFKLFKTLWKYYTSGTNDIRAFIIDNLLWMFKSNPSTFPVAQFLHLFEPTDTLQPSTLALLLNISSMKDLNHQLGEILLKIATIYYFQQLCASGALQIISNIVKFQRQTPWASQISQQILDKWPNLTIPPYQPVPTHSKKIKFRSVGLKKKEMMQFTQLNRYKNLLLALVQISDINFLNSYARSIISTIPKVSKSKSREMQSTKVWLSKLLELIESRIAQFKKTPLPLSEISFMLEQSFHEDSNDKSKLGPEDTISRIGLAPQQQNNEFIAEQPLYNPLLPFSQQEIQIHPLVSEEMYFQNYQQTFIKNLNQRYSRLLQFLTDKYRTALDLEQFLTSIGVMPYIQTHFTRLQEFEKTLTISEDQISKRVAKLILQTALIAFEFKHSRRVSIKCVESFYDLLVSKNLSQNSTELVNSQLKMETKMQFDPHITTTLKKTNFKILSQLLHLSVGVALIEPVSKVVTHITGASASKLTKSQIQQSIPEDELRQLQQLQKIIEHESAEGLNLSQMKSQKFRSPSIKNNQRKLVIEPPKQIEVSERWAEVQKKIIMRRRELQQKAIQK